MVRSFLFISLLVLNLLIRSASSVFIADSNEKNSNLNGNGHSISSQSLGREVFMDISLIQSIVSSIIGSLVGAGLAIPCGLWLDRKVTGKR